MITFKPIFKNKENTCYTIIKDGREKQIWNSRSCAMVAVVLGMFEKEIYALTIKRSEVMDFPNLYAVVSGYFDWNESALEALDREIYEETSLYLPELNKYEIHKDPEESPFFVNTNPKENRQNISLSYCVIYNFLKVGLPKNIENYKNKEVSLVKWMNIKDIDNYKWAFNHDERIKLALSKFFYLLSIPFNYYQIKKNI